MRLKKLMMAAILATGLCGTAAPQDSEPAKELVQWVKDARQSGLAEEDIRKSAVVAGWPEGAVSVALRSTSGESPKEKGEAKPDVATVAAEPAKNNTTDPAGPARAKEAPPQPLADLPAKGAASGAPAVPPTVAPAGTALTAPPAEAGVPKVDRGVPDDYEIGAGDVLHIMVFHEPDASVAGAVVRPDGRISMPLLKEVSVVGLTPPQLEKQITQQLAKSLVAPDVTVIVSGINSKKVYMVGAVKKEGPIPFTYRMTVMQALSEAGGLTDYAKKKKIYVLRNENGHEFQLHFDYDAVLKGQHMELNYPLIAGDTIVVPH